MPKTYDPISGKFMDNDELEQVRAQRRQEYLDKNPTAKAGDNEITALANTQQYQKPMGDNNIANTLAGIANNPNIPPPVPPSMPIGAQKAQSAQTSVREATGYQPSTPNMNSGGKVEDPKKAKEEALKKLRGNY